MRRSVSGIIAASAVACLWLPTLGCRSAEPANDAIPDTQMDSAGIAIVTNSEATWAGSPVWHVSNEPRTVIGSREYDPGHALLFVSSAMVLTDGRILMTNRGTSEIRMFDDDGRFLTSFGGEGPGPGEFRYLREVFRLGRDSIVVTEALGRAQVFDVGGQFGRQIQTGLIPGDGAILRSTVILGVFDSGELLVTPLFRPPPDEFVGVLRDTMYLSLLDPEGHLTSKIGRFLGRATYQRWDDRRLVSVRISTPYPRETLVRVAGGHLYVSDNARYEIQVRSPAGKLERVIRKAYREQQVGDDDMREYREHEMARMAIGAAGSRQQTWLAALKDVLSRIERPDVFPAIRDLLIDTEGCVWVREYVPATSETDWTVFGLDGTIVGRAKLPDALTAWDQVYEIGPDYVLGRVIGEDNVEFIHLYTLERTSAG